MESTGGVVEANCRHVVEVVGALGLEFAAPVPTLGVADKRRSTTRVQRGLEVRANREDRELAPKDVIVFDICHRKTKGMTMHEIADADWAADRQSRESVDSVTILHRHHFIETWVTQQTVVPTSTAEAELHFGDRAAIECLEKRVGNCACMLARQRYCL